MNNRINNTKLTQNSKIYILHGYYDESGQFHVEPCNSATLKHLPDDMSSYLFSNLNKGYDITAMISSKPRRILVFLSEDHNNKFDRPICEVVMKAWLDSALSRASAEGHVGGLYCNFPNE